MMPETFPTLSHFWLAYITFLIAILSPGPANMAIMYTALKEGKTAAIRLALGVITGSLFWGCSAAIGLGALLSQYASALYFLKILGGVYLLWLAFKAMRSAYQAKPIASHQRKHQNYYIAGLLLHLTNPKSVFAWMMVIAIGLPPNAPVLDAIPIISSCFLTATVVFLGFAVVFSKPKARQIYQQNRRYIEGAVALVFGVAAVALLTTKLPTD